MVKCSGDGRGRMYSGCVYKQQLICVWMRGIDGLCRVQTLEGSKMSTLFYIVTAIVIGGGCAYAIWYAKKQEKRP